MRSMSECCNFLSIAILVALTLGLCLGCFGDPELHPVTGKVTLQGKSYERLIVYFRPLQGEISQFNMGVGETDGSGNLALRSSAGNGLAAGTYRVAFSCMTVRGTGAVPGMDEKADDNQNIQMVERVPTKYADLENSPVEFEVRAGTNEFIFDIPKS